MQYDNIYLWLSLKRCNRFAFDILSLIFYFRRRSFHSSAYELFWGVGFLNLYKEPDQCCNYFNPVIFFEGELDKVEWF